MTISTTVNGYEDHFSLYSKYCESHEENMPSSKSTPKNDCLDLKYDIGILNIMFLCV